MIDRVSIAARVTGTVVAGSYLLGLTDGPVMMVIGGLALVTFGRGLVVDRAHEALAGAAVAVIAGALGVSALRWGSFELSEIRGVQGVLGPTLTVGPDEVAFAAAAAAVAGVVAHGVWRAEAPEGGRSLVALESLVAALALVTAFWGPTPRGGGLGGWTTWVGLVVAIAAVAWVIGAGIRRTRRALAWGAVAAGAAATVASALLIAVAR